ncbi:MAG: hypothetical protein DBY45_01850 [Clostridiales bacterium]|nr:MAG: hypothetical protein DBY45_01850 [Clostridiales bacterium]
MTKVFAEERESCFTLILYGHATGSEKVCAAISSIVYALAGYLKNVEDERGEKPPVIQLKSGFSSFRFSGKEAKSAYDMAVIGLMQLEKQYPEFIQFEKNKNFLDFRGANEKEL